MKYWKSEKHLTITVMVILVMVNLDSIFKSRDIANKGLSSQGYGFSCGHVWTWELDCEEGWALKNWCFWTVVLEKTLESPLDCKEIPPVYSEGDQPWDFFGRNDAKAETPVLWPPYAKSWLFGKDSDAGRDWGQEEKGKTEDEMAGWHHWLNAHEFGWTPGVGDGQGGLACCDSWGRKELDMTKQLNWTELTRLLGFSHSSVGKESACRRSQFDSWVGKSAGEGIGYPLLYSWLPLWLSW